MQKQEKEIDQQTSRLVERLTDGYQHLTNLSQREIRH